MDAVSPAEREEVSEEMEMEGGRVSIVRVRELSGSAPSALRLPAASEKAAEVTEISPASMESVVGVNVAE